MKVEQYQIAKQWLEENEDTNIYTCSSCSSSYIIYEKDEEEYLWFINYRREK